MPVKDRIGDLMLPPSALPTADSKANVQHGAILCAFPRSISPYMF